MAADDALTARIERLERAVCQIALAAMPDMRALSPTSPLSGSGHVRAKAQTYSPDVAALVELYLAAAVSSAADSAERIAAQVADAHRAADRGRSEGALLDRHAEQRENKRKLYSQLT